MDVFDFKEEDELAEFTAGKALKKFKSSSIANHKINQFHDCVAKGPEIIYKKTENVTCIDVDAVESYQNHDDAVIFAHPGKVGKEPTIRKERSLSGASSGLRATDKHQPCDNVDNYEHLSFCYEEKKRAVFIREPSPGKTQSNHSLTDYRTSSDPDVEPYVDPCSNEISSSRHNVVENCVFPVGKASDNSFAELQTDDINVTVDYIEYRGNYCIGGLVTFTCRGIKISDSTDHGNKGILGIERGIDDIIDIKSQHVQRFGSLLMKFRFLSRAAEQADSTNCASGIEEVKFAVVDPDWGRKQEGIMGLNKKYTAIWNSVHHLDATSDDDDFVEKGYFPNFSKAFDAVVYPDGDADAVSLSKRDVDLLQPETFVNDTIIDFYINYLKNQIPHEEKHRFHFFNSFFFRKLADMDKDPSSALDGKAAFLRVRKWTRKVDIFGKDYVFIPVNFNLHWSLLVLCHPGDVAGFRDEDSLKSSKVPCILHMDSIRGTHAGLKNLIQSYLWEEWKERQNEKTENTSSKFLNMRFIPLELPQQQNSFDCGLFLLHYLELFLAEAPSNFSPFTITKVSNFLDVDWFPPAEASLKRSFIQRLVSGLIENHCREDSSPEGRDEIEPPENNESDPYVDCNEDLLDSQSGEGVEITLLSSSSSLKNSQHISDTGLVLHELLEPGTIAGSLLSSPDNHLDTTTPFETDSETKKQVLSPGGGTLRGYIADTLLSQEFSMQGEGDHTNSSQGTSPSKADDVAIENTPPGQNVHIDNATNDQQLFVEDSQPEEETYTSENLAKGQQPLSSERLDSCTIECTQDGRILSSHGKILVAEDSQIGDDMDASENPEDGCHEKILVAEDSQIGDDMDASENPEDGHMLYSHEIVEDSQIGDDIDASENPVATTDCTRQDPENNTAVENRLHQDSEIVEDVPVIDDGLAKKPHRRSAKRLRLTLC